MGCGSGFIQRTFEIPEENIYFFVLHDMDTNELREDPSEPNSDLTKFIGRQISVAYG